MSANLLCALLFIGARLAGAAYILAFLDALTCVRAASAPVIARRHCEIAEKRGDVRRSSEDLVSRSWRYTIQRSRYSLALVGLAVASGSVRATAGCAGLVKASISNKDRARLYPRLTREPSACLTFSHLQLLTLLIVCLTASIVIEYGVCDCGASMFLLYSF